MASANSSDHQGQIKTPTKYECDRAGVLSDDQLVNTSKNYVVNAAIKVIPC
jgi:hypothetical protein